MSWNAKKTAARTAALLSCYFAARGFADMAGGDSLPAQWMILAVLSGLFLLLNLRFFRRTQAKESGIRLSGVILAAVFDFCFVTGFMLEQSGQQEILPLRDAPVLRFLFYAALLWNTVLLTAEADRMIDRPSTPGRDSEQAIRKWLRFLPLILFAGWLPHWIANFPGSVCNDARDQLEMAMGVIPLTNHNPVLDTWIFGGLYRIGKGVSGSGNAGIALIVFVQTALMALSFSLVIAEGYEWMLRRKRNGAEALTVPFSCWCCCCSASAW